MADLDFFLEGIGEKVKQKNKNSQFIYIYFPEFTI